MSDEVDKFNKRIQQHIIAVNGVLIGSTFIGLAVNPTSQQDERLSQVTVFLGALAFVMFIASLLFAIVANALTLRERRGGITWTRISLLVGLVGIALLTSAVIALAQLKVGRALHASSGLSLALTIALSVISFVAILTVVVTFKLFYYYD